MKLIQLQPLILGLILLLCFFATLSFSKHGEILKKMTGEVHRCEMLGGSNITSPYHATIKTEYKNYIIASLKDCKPNEKVKILIRRGALYFNTVYTAEKYNQ